jgi:hypothetical protein
LFLRFGYLGEYGITFGFYVSPRLSRATVQATVYESINASSLLNRQKSICGSGGYF